jgi:hypothetical protein
MHMKKNMGAADRVVRLILAAVLGFLYFNHNVTGTFGIIFLVVAIVLLLTSFVSFCPLYAALGLKTRKTKEANT